MPLLEVDHLSIAFGLHQAVQNLSFTLDHGQTLGLVGESGSGKSATSLALLRLLPPPPKSQETLYLAAKIYPLSPITLCANTAAAKSP